MNPRNFPKVPRKVFEKRLDTAESTARHESLEECNKNNRTRVLFSFLQYIRVIRFSHPTYTTTETDFHKYQNKIYANP